MNALTWFPLAAALAAPTAFAQGLFEAQGAAHLSLTRAALVPEAESELDADERVVKARHGLRREAELEFAAARPLAIDEVYVVRDALGAPHRVRVSLPSRGTVRVVLLTSEATAPVVPGTFRSVRTTVNGRPADSVYRPLVLRPDGTYKQGQASGRWTVVDGRLRLSEGLASWGAGLLAGDGRAVTFCWTRGPLTWEVTWDLADDSPRLAAGR